MDFLRSLGLEDLPEQQTKTMHLMARHPEFSLKLGIDACCTCGSPFTPSSTIIDCRRCQRVSYCSESCREQDSSGMNAADIEGITAEDEQETAMGHSSVICSLLKLCNNDEVINEEVKDDQSTWTALENDPQAKEAAIDRVRSEFESYPATLANVILEGPMFLPYIEKAGKNLVIHIVGASHDAELWQSPCMEKDDVFGAYADALAELSETRRLDTIELHFVGPECPKENIQQRRGMKTLEGRVTGELIATSHYGEYNTKLLKREEVSKADIVVFHNPGFTCPDYSWTKTLASIPKGTPFLVTTNTELEGIADCQFLLDNDLLESIPPMLADIFGDQGIPVYTMDDDREEGDPSGPFFNENPFCGNRVRQSGTMANDLFVKNRWMLGGILDSQSKQPPNKRRVTNSSYSNSKSSNPALI